jgi:hypothetical protein
MTSKHAMHQLFSYCIQVFVLYFQSYLVYCSKRVLTNLEIGYFKPQYVYENP